MSGFQIEITQCPTGYESDGSYKRADFAEPMVFAGFRSYTGRRAASLYGTGAQQVTFAGGGRQPKSWVKRETAEANVARLDSRGYTARVVPVPSPTS